MNILSRYLFFSIFRSTIAILLGLSLIVSFFKFLDEMNSIGEGIYNFNHALNYTLLLIPSIFNSFLTTSIMIAVVFVLGSLNSNKELQILYTASISTKEIIFKVIKFCFLFSILLIFLLELITPISLKMANHIKNEAIGVNSSYGGNSFWTKENDKFIFSKQEKENKDLKNFLIFKFNEEQELNSLSFGKTGETQENNKDPNQITIDKYGEFYQVKKLFQRNTELIDIGERNSSLFKIDPKVMSIIDLINSSLFLLRHNMNNKIYLIELLERLIKPLTLIGMILVTLPFVMDFGRSLSIGNRVFLATSVGVMTHLLSKIFGVFSASVDAHVLIIYPIPTLILISSGLLLLKFRLRGL